MGLDKFDDYVDLLRRLSNLEVELGNEIDQVNREKSAELAQLKKTQPDSARAQRQLEQEVEDLLAEGNVVIASAGLPSMLPRKRRPDSPSGLDSNITVETAISDAHASLDELKRSVGTLSDERRAHRARQEQRKREEAAATLAAAEASERERLAQLEQQERLARRNRMIAIAAVAVVLFILATLIIL